MRVVRPDVAVRLGVLLLLLQIPLQFAGSLPSLHAQVQAPESLLGDPPRLVGPAKVADRGVVRSREVTVHIDRLRPPTEATRADVAASTIVLNLFPDVTYTAVQDRIDPVSRGFVWVGHIPGVEGSSVTLAVDDRVMAGSIVTPSAAYVIRYAGGPGGDVHTVAEVDQSTYRPEAPPIPITAPEPDAVNPQESALTGVPIRADDGSTIDVMVLYTPAVVSARGGDSAVRALVNLGISETNTSYANSVVTQRVRLVYTGLVSYPESGSMATDLENIQTSTGALAGVGGLRNTYAADVVSLWVHYTSGPCGIGYFMAQVNAGFAPYAYNVTDHQCIPNYTFAHEMGHNMGTTHDWYVDNGVLPYSYAHGYVNAAGGWRTIMAYNDQCADQGFSCTRLPYWSNPQRTAPMPYPAALMGVAGGTDTSCTPFNLSNPQCDADDTRTLNNTALTVSNFRQSVAGPLVVAALVPSAGPPAAAGTTVTWTATVNGGTGPYTYKFFVFDGTTWTVGQDWSTANTWTWTPAATGSYNVQVWVRSAGSSATYDAWLGTASYAVTAPPALRVTGLSPSPGAGISLGASAVWGATATGGTGPYTYKFLIYNGATWSVGQNWSAASTWTWTPSAAGSYNVQVWVRNAGSIADYDAWLGTAAYSVTAPPPLRVTGLSPSPASSLSLGDSVVVWTALTTGGTGPFTYKFYIYDGTTWAVGQDWSSANTWTWTPSAVATYSVQVWVRNAGSSASYDAWLGSPPYIVTPSVPLTVTGLSPSTPSPAALGTGVVWTAMASGGASPRTYKFFIYNGTTWAVGQDWSTASTWTWTPSTPGTYWVQVWVRNAGSGASYDAWLGSAPYIVAPLTAINLSGFSGSEFVETFSPNFGRLTSPVLFHGVTYASVAGGQLWSDIIWQNSGYYTNWPTASGGTALNDNVGRSNLQIDFSTPVNRVGVFVATSPVTTFTMTAYDDNLAIIGSVTQTMPASARAAFLGLDSLVNVRRVVIAEPFNNNNVSIFDDLRFEAAPPADRLPESTAR